MDIPTIGRKDNISILSTILVAARFTSPSLPIRSTKSVKAEMSRKNWTPEGRPKRSNITNSRRSKPGRILVLYSRWYLAERKSPSQ